jgi:hypothetical protein
VGQTVRVRQQRQLDVAPGIDRFYHTNGVQQLFSTNTFKESKLYLKQPATPKIQYLSKADRS